MEKTKIRKVAVVILTCNALELLKDCLDSLKNNKNNHYQITIFVVDNDTKNDTGSIIASKYPEVILIQNKINYGFSKGINFGLRLAYKLNFDWIMLLNDDTIVKPETIINLIKESERNKYLISGPVILTKDGNIWSEGGILDKLRYSGGLSGFGQKKKAITKNTKTGFVSGTAMLVHNNVFKKVGFLDEDYFLYYDDVDFCFRASLKGMPSYIIPSSQIIHLETATIKKNSPSHYYHSAKSHLIFVFKRAPLNIKLREILRLFKTFFELMTNNDPVKKKYELKAISDFLLMRVGQRTSIKPKFL